MLGMMTGSLPPGCPIRKSTGQRVFAPYRGLSQLVTSFFASKSLGILHVPFSPFLIMSPFNCFQVFVGRTSLRLLDRSFDLLVFSFFEYTCVYPQLP